jgi:LAGLIDADG endonuclease
MKSLVEYWGCGRIEASSTESVVRFSVNKFEDINNQIIPFFQKYPLQGIKLSNFLDFFKVAELIKDKAHLTEEGLEKIVNIKSGMNTGRK